MFVFIRQLAIGKWQSPPIAIRHSTFIEVLFAVILLGIGFIMIAGIFPVAIQQTAAVSDETQGTAHHPRRHQKNPGCRRRPGRRRSARAGTTNTTFNRRMVRRPSRSPAFFAEYHPALGNDPFFTADHRFGWVGFYRA